ncbi:MAG: SUMF1/EgtB/PvdO family nonheme iron enzyme [Anaerolineales bacterium]
MTKLFISYSRKDKNSAEKLVNCLVGEQTDVWIDWADIPPSTDWWEEIKRGIEEADVFLFLTSPDSISSRVCAEEVGHAVKNGKRLVPVVVRDVSPVDAPPEISKLNWVFLREADPFQEFLKKLDVAIHTDFDWVQIHREVQVKALKWERQSFENSLLLHGKELEDTEKYFRSKHGVDPRPTALQQSFILKSRQLVIRQRKILTVIASGLLAVFIGIFSFVPVRNAIYRWQALELGETVPIEGGAALFGNARLAKTNNALKEETRPVDAFRLEIYEVTYKRYSLCVDAGICTRPNGTFNEEADANKPVVQVTVIQAMEFCSWIGRQLPSELQWERAARGTNGLTWPWGDVPPSDNLYANLNYEKANPGTLTTNTVGSSQKGVSKEGAFDLIGNVWEWTCTPEGGDPDACWVKTSDPSIPAAFVTRGAGANIPPGPFVVSAYRESATWDYSQDRFLGFRCVEQP